MFGYRTYGLNIKSSREISILREHQSEYADLSVDWHTSLSLDDTNWILQDSELLDMMKEVSVWKSESSDQPMTRVSFSPEGNRTITLILDSKGENLSIHHSEVELQSNLESYFVGPVMSFVMRLRGDVCLHASAVGAGGRAIAFVGYSTAGKSTMAAGMARAGASILADDIVALRSNGEGFSVESGYARVRLRPKAASFLTDDPSTLPLVYSYRDSFYYSMEDDSDFESNALPLGAIYLLGEVSDDYREPQIKNVKPQDRLIELIKNTSGLYVVRGELRASEFQTLSQIAQTIPIRRLLYAHDIETLPRQCELILDDFRNLTGEYKIQAS